MFEVMSTIGSKTTLIKFDDYQTALEVFDKTVQDLGCNDLVWMLEMGCNRLYWDGSKVHEYPLMG